MNTPDDLRHLLDALESQLPPEKRAPSSLFKSDGVEHWIVGNIRRELDVLESGLLVTQKHGFSRPDREIVAATVSKSGQTTIRDADSDSVLVQGAKKEIQLLTVDVNTALGEPIRFQDIYESAFEYVRQIMQKLLSRSNKILTNPSN